MSLQHPDQRRNLPIRLCDIRPAVLYSAARQAAKHETDPAIIDDILAAACHPSENVYWVDNSARPIVERIAA